MKRITILLLIVTTIVTFSTAQTSGTETFRQEGIASWYGGEFDGKPTASGEIFNSGYYTAAHPTLPFGTILVITNKQNNRRVTVRVNDRGPFVAARIIDLSRAAAESLDMLTTGTAPVIVERALNTALGPGGEPLPSRPAEIGQATPPIAPLPQPAPPPQAIPQPAPQPAPVPQPIPAPQYVPQVEPQYAPQPVPQPAPQYAPQPVPQPAPQYAPQPAPQPAPPPTVQPAYNAPPAVLRGATPPASSPRLYRLQVGAYGVPRNAVDAFDKLKGAGLSPAYERSGELYRVVLPGIRAADIPAMTQTLGNLGFREALIREETGN